MLDFSFVPHINLLKKKNIFYHSICCSNLKSGYIKQDRHFTCNMTAWRVRAAVFVLLIQRIISHSEKCSARYCHIFAYLSCKVSVILVRFNES